MRPKNEGAIKPAAERQVKIWPLIFGKLAVSLPGLPEGLCIFAMASIQLMRHVA
jgi:hypothetical protein